MNAGGSMEELPIAVIGAGPVGLAAAAHLAERGMPFVVLEASAEVAASFASVAHVRLFSPWRMNVDAAAVRLLEEGGWSAPDPDALPTAGEMRSRYLEPLAAHPTIAPSLRLATRVEAVTRRGHHKVSSKGREEAPFVLRLRGPGGPSELLARAVVDASGTWSTPSPLGMGGIPAVGEHELAARVAYGMPDVLGAARARYAGKRVLVVGGGHSAAGTILALAELARSEPATSIAWAVRGRDLTRLFGGGASDGLPARGALGTTLRALVERGALEIHTSTQIRALEPRGRRVDAIGEREGEEVRIEGVDEIVAATGARPDLSITRELRLGLDPWIESTRALAPLIDPNLHSCGSVPPHGHRELEHPEPDYFAVGAKSYGRAPNFLLATGYEQARSVVARLAGDFAAADDVQLVLPETGVCVTDLEGGEEAASCCGPTPPAEATVAAPEVAAACCAPPERGAPPPEVQRAACCSPTPPTRAPTACCG